MKQDYLKKLSRELLLNLIQNGNVLECCGAICEIVSRKRRKGMVVGSDVKDAILDKRDNTTPFWNTYTIGDFATAALHLIEDTPYNGDRAEVASLIQSQMDF